MFAVVVTLEIKQSELNAFIPLMKANAQASLAQEPDCHQFDICTNGGDQVLLYELYSNEAAFRTHLKTNHFLEFDQATAHMILDKKVHQFTEVIQ